MKVREYNFTSEVDLNEWLKASRTLGEDYISRGKTEIGLSIIQIASKLAIQVIDANEFNKPLLCPSCKRLYTNAIEKEAIRFMGECLGCDHVRGEMLADTSAYDDRFPPEESEAN